MVQNNGKNYRKMLKISQDALDSVNQFLVDEKNPLINNLFEIIEKYGGIDEINKKAENAGKLDNLLEKVERKKRCRSDLKKYISQFMSLFIPGKKKSTS